MSNTPPPNASIQGYHPAYSAPDASLVLLSHDGIRFRVHPFLLQMSSEVFSNMLIGAVDTGELLQLEEKGDILKVLLDMIYPNTSAFRFKGQNFDFIWTLLLAADKYGFHKILDEFRLRLLSDLHFVADSLKKNAIACRFDWKEEMLATTLSALDELSNPHSWETFAKMDAAYVLKLQKLSAVRKGEIIRNLRDSFFCEYEFKDIWNEKFSTDRKEEDGIDDESVIKIFLSLLGNELEKFPSGRTLRFDFWDREEVAWLFDSKENAKSVQDCVLELLRRAPDKLEDKRVETGHLYLNRYDE